MSEPKEYAADEVMLAGEERRPDGSAVAIKVYGDHRREETEITNVATGRAAAAGGRRVSAAKSKS